MLLSLSDFGIERIKVIGPAGLRGLLAMMAPFTNRKYPLIDMVEVETQESRSFQLDHFSVKIIPLVHSNSSASPGPVLAIAAIISNQNISTNSQV